MSPTAGLRSPPSKQGARASVEMEPSDVPVFDWPGAGAVWVALTKRGWLAHTRAVGAERWVVEARWKSWPEDRWGTLHADGHVR
ncbi:MAG: hypothetical protein ACLQBX_18160 [Candidatus Limnocylindrales bacterium]|jgi:hypothetical protein